MNNRKAFGSFHHKQLFMGKVALIYSMWTCKIHCRYYLPQSHTEREKFGVHADGYVPTAALNNLRKWFVMFSLELKLNLEVKRQSTKPQCWDSWNRKQLSPEEARAGFELGDSPQKRLLQLNFSNKNCRSIEPQRVMHLEKLARGNSEGETIFPVVLLCSGPAP